jgi:acyl carrier protein
VEPQIIADKIKKFLLQQFPATKNIGNNDSLLNNGIIDSLGILEVVTFMEQEFGISVSDDDLLPENFGSVSRLLKFVQEKKNGAR